MEKTTVLSHFFHQNFDDHTPIPISLLPRDTMDPYLLLFWVCSYNCSSFLFLNI